MEAAGIASVRSTSVSAATPGRVSSAVTKSRAAGLAPALVVARAARSAASNRIAPGWRSPRRLSRRSFGRASYTHGVDVYVDLLRYRELFGSLFRRDLRARYKGSVLGVAWSLANPVLLMLVYLLVFSVFWRAQPAREIGRASCRERV